MSKSTETITYRGREYRLERTGDPEHPYRLHGPRGACYELWRSVNDQLFVVNYKTIRVLEGWFIDKDSKLMEMQ